MNVASCTEKDGLRPFLSPLYAGCFLLDLSTFARIFTATNLSIYFKFCMLTGNVFKFLLTRRKAMGYKFKLVYWDFSILQFFRCVFPVFGSLDLIDKVDSPRL